MARSLVGRCAIAVFAVAGVLAPAAARPPEGHDLFISHHPHIRAAAGAFVVLDELPLVSLLDRRGEIDSKLFGVRSSRRDVDVVPQRDDAASRAS